MNPFLQVSGIVSKYISKVTRQLPFNLSDYNEIEILFAVAAGDQQAFRKLFYQHKDRIYGIALRYTGDEFTAEEIVQDSFVRVWKNREKLTDIINFQAWLYQIVRNCCFTALRKMAAEGKRKEELLSWNPSELTRGEGAMEGLHFQELLKKALDCLSPQQRKVFELSRIQGLDRAIIAGQLGLSPATVSVHLTIALRIVRAFLAAHLELFLWALLLFR